MKFHLFLSLSLSCLLGDLMSMMFIFTFSEKRKVPIKKIRALADNGDKLSKEYRNIESIAKYTEALDLLTQGPLKGERFISLM